MKESIKTSNLTVIEGNLVTDYGIRLTKIVIDNTTGNFHVISDENSENFLSLKTDIFFSQDCLIFPGMIDLHIHAREDASGIQNHKEDYFHSSLAAINGGVTTMAAMPNTPEPLITEERYNWHRNKSNCCVNDCFNYVGIGPGTKPLKGKKFYKVYTGPSVGELFFRSKEELEETLKYYEGENISFHVEDFEILEKNKHEKTHSLRRPRDCVVRALDYLLPIIEKYSIRAKLCHWPISGDSLVRIASHKNRMEQLNLKFNTTLEVSPMHLYFDIEQLEANPFKWPYLQMNPALRSNKDRMGLIEALKDGCVDFIATDHAPHTLEEKFSNFAEYRQIHNFSDNESAYRDLLIKDPEECKRICLMNGTSGAPWLDYYGAVAYDIGNKYNFSMKRILEITSSNASDFLAPYTHGAGKIGRIEKGYKADLTVIDKNIQTHPNREDVKSKCGWSPLEGVTLDGAVKCVIKSGRILKNL